MEQSNNPMISTNAIVAFSTAAAITAAAVAVSLQLSLRRKQVAAPQDILDICKQSLKNIERDIEGLS